jgi:hypothetical protein
MVKPEYGKKTTEIFGGLFYAAFSGNSSKLISFKARSHMRCTSNGAM